MNSDTPYCWRMTAKAALRWIIRAEKNIQERMAMIENNESQRQEYLRAKETWQALRGAEVRIAEELRQIE